MPLEAPVTTANGRSESGLIVCTHPYRLTITYGSAPTRPAPAQTPVDARRADSEQLRDGGVVQVGQECGRVVVHRRGTGLAQLVGAGTAAGHPDARQVRPGGGLDVPHRVADEHRPP